MISRTKTLTEAAKGLQVPKSSASRGIPRLELELGILTSPRGTVSVTAPSRRRRKLTGPLLGRATMDSMKRGRAKRQFSAVAQMVVFGPRKVKMLDLSMGID
jgi:hypothetical protein